MNLSGQLLRLLDNRLLDPLEILLGDDRPVDDVRTMLRIRVADWVRTLQSGDDAAAVQVISRLIGTLYPDDHAFTPPADWWRTPLGQIVVRRVGHPFTASVSYSTAGAMLGISRQGVHDLVRRGRLPRHPDGGVPVSAIRDRLRASPTNHLPLSGPSPADPLPGDSPRGDQPLGDSPSADTPPSQSPLPDSHPSQSPDVDSPPSQSTLSDSHPSHSPLVDSPPSRSPDIDSPPSHSPLTDSPAGDSPASDPFPNDSPPSEGTS